MGVHVPSFVCFLIFNILFGLTGLALIAGGIYIWIKTKSFNYIPLGLIVIGIITFIIFVIGLSTRKKLCLLVLYLIFIFIFFLLYAGCAILFKFWGGDLINYLEENSEKNKYDEKDLKIIEDYIVYLFILSCVVAGICLFAFISGIVFGVKQRGDKNKAIKIEDVQRIDCLTGIDYTVLEP